MKTAVKKIWEWKHLLPVILLLASFASHFAYFGYPKEVVFDEVYFGKFASNYITGNYFFDLHPPLGKLLISFVGQETGANTSQSYTSIGNTYSGSAFKWLRFLPSLAGTLLPLVIYLLCLELGFSKSSSFVAGLLIILENSLLVQSRLILIDSMLLLFGFLGLLFYEKYRRSGRILQLFFSGFFLAGALSTKWTGLSFLGLVLLCEVWNILKNKKWQLILHDFCFLVILPTIFYVSIFAVHFALLPKSGDGDAFMSAGFLKTLVGSKYSKDASVQAETFPQKFIELNKEMYSANATLTATHPYSSKWYTWPFMSRPIYYWVQSRGGADAKIYLLGNPFIYWLSSLAVIFLSLNFLARVEFLKKDTKLVGYLLLGYFMNLLPFIFIGRVMFLYHYSTALVFAVITLVFAIEKISKTPTIARNIFIGISVLCIVSFFFFAPLSYGLPLTPKAQDLRFWFPSWR
ncbi:MAG: phospholipid carrier-dependent glycosyltransferase [Candidatus Pacebacteria bacterium]|nr:phospholipid carrier-dependent glycosyltransferase [Candidatus Paceibacterota bacterium]